MQTASSARLATAARTRLRRLSLIGAVLWVAVTALPAGEGPALTPNPDAGAGADAAALTQPTLPLPYRWFFVESNLQKDGDVVDMEALCKIAHAHGYNGMVLTGMFGRIDLQKPAYFDRLAAIKRAADQNGIEIIPLVFSVGEGGDVLAHDRNLAEGFLVQDAPFVVKNGQAILQPDPDCRLPNGSFEQHHGDEVSGPFLQDAPGKTSFVDEKIAHGGTVSLRFDHLDAAKNGHARIAYDLPVQPHRLYEVSYWVRTRGFGPAGALHAEIIADNGEQLALQSTGPAENSDWTEHRFLFNSLEYKKMRLYLGAWDAKQGAFWIDDCAFRAVGLNNLLRRPGAPLTVAGATDGTAYVEGKDFEPVRDPNLDFRADHDDVPIVLTKNSRIQEGEKLKVSWYHGLAIHDDRVCICMSEPAVYKIWADEVKLIQAHIAPDKYLFDMDEIREAGSDPACQARKLSLAQILGDCVTREEGIVRAANPKAQAFIWSDMLNPDRNGHAHYSLAQGDFTGAWQYIPKDIGIVSWAATAQSKELKLFADHGFHTVAAAYYDKDDLKNCQGWLDLLKTTPGAEGIMYTTWEHNYKLFTDFGDMISRP
ncbi:MAG: hypothetical protein ACREJ2_13685 [Planctomycetota bacterium]